ncbi:uncharacterized protein [Fopius arisanus]|uniref:Uncharacterized protein n=1 Tax=Fopius arisanus TaxID=64838 RepID=A0A9R1TYE8_9HYME|nr:PREDICTED: uncharacterized protein LOC105266162 [Fopius arisanus]
MSLVGFFQHNILKFRRSKNCCEHGKQFLPLDFFTPTAQFSSPEIMVLVQLTSSLLALFLQLLNISLDIFLTFFPMTSLISSDSHEENTENRWVKNTQRPDNMELKLFMQKNNVHRQQNVNRR